MSGMGGRSPPRGGAAAGAANQQFLADTDEEEADDDRQQGATADPETKRVAKRQKVSLSSSFYCVRAQELLELRCTV